VIGGSKKKGVIELRPILLDVDTGVDDAIAILLAVRSPLVKLLGITTVSGNVEVDTALQNTLAVLDHIDAEEIPVARGMDAPLIKTLVTAKEVHGSEGLGNLKVTPSSRKIAEEHGVDLMIRTIKQSPEPITLVMLGPLTNLAVALKKDRSIVHNLKELVIMGGADSAGGNITPVAEFNIYVDPEAAQVVFDSGIPICLVTWDVTLQAYLTREEVEQLALSQDKASRLSADLILFLMTTFQREDVPLCDPAAMVAVLDEQVIETNEYPIEVEVNGTITRGMTVIDTRPFKTVQVQDPRPRVHVAEKLNRDRFKELFINTLNGK
jgi:inosine-uridine nucleoside N-ribohydrolase